MSKTTALTFTAAVVLFVACLATSIYGQRIAEDRRYTPDGQFLIYYEAYGMELNSWQRLSGLTGLLAVSVTIAGVMLWNRELYPRAQRVSVLGLDGRAKRRTLRAAVPRKNMTAAEVRVDESRAYLHADESLTPLERVIRGY